MLIPTILCGGAGSRLWPVSRELHPKPFMRLADNESLLQKAFLRSAALADVSEILTITNRELSFKTRDEYGSLNKRGLHTSFVLEPIARNTAPAIAAASIYAAQKHGEDVCLLVLPADHLITEQTSFAKAVTAAVKLAQQGKIVTFGIHPDKPETGYGYIEAHGNKVLRFVEKPDSELAKEYLASGKFLWNAGMFCFTAKAMLAELAKYSPDILEKIENCMQKSVFAEGLGFSQTELLYESFSTLPDISIDYAIMEKSDVIAVVPCSIGWSDIGSWSAICDLTDQDQQGNRIDGQAIVHDASDCYIQSRERLVGLLGVKNLMVIDTPDALLIAHKDSAQEVKNIYTKLQELGHNSYKIHRTAHRPWGTYTVIEEGNRFKIKRIVVKPGASLSLQMHHHRSEHWIVVSGTAEVTNEDSQFMLHTDQSTYIPAGNKHRLKNPGLIDLVMIEVQSGEYLEEDDIVRFSDDYGRAPVQAPQPLA